MASNKKLKSRVNKSKKLNKSRFPRWTKFVVIGLVAVVGIVFIVRTFAAGVFPISAKKVIPGGSVGLVSSASSMARSPLIVEACRMSDTPGAGPENRVYVGAKPVVSKVLADRMNKVWDPHFPEYHIDGQDVPWAVDNLNSQQIYYEANYIVDNNDRSDTAKAYTDLLKPSEVDKLIPTGQYNYDIGPKSYLTKNGFGPWFNIRKEWLTANYLYNVANYNEKPLSQSEQSEYINNKLGSNRNARGGNFSAVPANPGINYISANQMPGKTIWSYIEGPVALYNKAKCPADANNGYGCQNKPESYDLVNNPNPLIKFDVSWLGGRQTGVINGEGAWLNDHVVNVVRFKDLPKCGRTPLPTVAEQYAKADKYTKLVKDLGLQAKVDAAYRAAGIDPSVAQTTSNNYKMRLINWENGLNQVNFWTGKPANDLYDNTPGYGTTQVSRPYPY